MEKLIRFWESIQKYIKQIFKSYNKANRNKDWNFPKKVVTVNEYFSRYILHWRDHEYHHCKISGKDLNIMESRMLWRWLWRFDLLIGRCWMFPMTSQCNSIDGVLAFTIICFTEIMESLWRLPLRRLSRHLPFGLGLISTERRWAKTARVPGLLWPLETSPKYMRNKLAKNRSP